MIKSFIYKILKKELKEERKSEEIKLNLDNLENKISELKNEEDGKAVSEGKTIIDNIKSDIKYIKISLKKLNEKEISNKDERIYGIVKGSKKVLATHISSGLNKVVISEKIDYCSLKELNSYLTMFFNSISKDAKNFYYTSLVFRDHMKEITDGLKKLEDENKKLKEIIDSENIINLNDISIKIKSIKNNQDEIQKIEKQKRELEQTIKQDEQSNIQLKEQIEKLRNSKQYKYFLENKEKIKELEAEIEHTETNIRNQLSLLIKSLKKFGHMETDRDKIKNISLIIKDPVDFSLKNYSEFKNILIDLKKLIIDNKIHLESKDKEKKLSQIREIENGSLYNLLENYNKFNIDLEQTKKMKFSVLNEIIELENQLYTINNKFLETKILKNIDSIKKVKQDIISEKQKIQELCLKIDKNIIIL